MRAVKCKWSADLREQGNEAVVTTKRWNLVRSLGEEGFSPAIYSTTWVVFLKTDGDVPRVIFMSRDAKVRRLAKVYAAVSTALRQGLNITPLDWRILFQQGRYHDRICKE